MPQVVCKYCNSSFSAAHAQRKVCDDCRVKKDREINLRAQKRYEQSAAGKATKHKYQGAEGKKARQTPSQEQVVASQSARFARD